MKVKITAERILAVRSALQLARQRLLEYEANNVKVDLNLIELPIPDYPIKLPSRTERKRARLENELLNLR
jgi:hypothetical protein